MDQRNHPSTASSNDWNSRNGSSSAQSGGGTSSRSFLHARRTNPAAAAQHQKATDEIKKQRYESLLAQSQNCRVQRFLSGEMDEVEEELPFRLDIMEKREFIEELGVDELAWSMRVDQLLYLEKLANYRKKLKKREEERADRERNRRRRPHKSTTAPRHFYESRNHRRRDRAYYGEQVEVYQFYEFLPPDQDANTRQQSRQQSTGNDVETGGTSSRRALEDEMRRLETDEPSTQQIATDSLRRRMQEGLIVFRLNGADRKTTSADVLHLTNSRKPNAMSSVDNKVFVRSKGDLLVSDEDRIKFLEQQRKQEERRRAKEKNVESRLARAQLAAAEQAGVNGVAKVADFIKIKPDEYDYIPVGVMDAVPKPPSAVNEAARSAGSQQRGSLASSNKSKTRIETAEEGSDDEPDDNGFEVITVGKRRIRARKIRVPNAVLAQYHSNRNASARAKEIIDRSYNNAGDEDDDSIVSDDLDEELHAAAADSDDSYDDRDDTGVRDLDKFYVDRYGVNLTKKERTYNVYMRQLFELQPNEVFDGTSLLLRKATLRNYSDADIRRDLSCGLFPGGIRVICEPDQDLEELKSFVYTEYIQFEAHTQKLIPREMRCRCGICDCRSGCDGCGCKKDHCSCSDYMKCPHKGAFRYKCKLSKRCIFNARVAEGNHYLAPYDKDGSVSWASILKADNAAYDEVADDEDVSTQLYEYLVLVCGPRCACSCAVTTPVGYGPNPKLAGCFELRMTRDYGWGVFTTMPIKKGTYLFEYAGQVMSSTFIEKRKRQSHYVFDVPIADEMVPGMGNQEILCLDAIDMGNLSRFVNHSCSDNCIARRVFIGHTHSAMSRLVYFTRRDIAAGEELSLDYQWDWWVHMHKTIGITCKCGQPCCKYTTELMPEVLKEHAADRGYSLDDDNDSQKSDDDDDTVKTEAEREAEAAAAAVNAAAADEEARAFLDVEAFEAVLGIKDHSNVIRRGAATRRNKKDDDEIEIALMNATSRQARNTIQRSRRDLKMMTMTAIPENPTDIVIPERPEEAGQLETADDGGWADDEIEHMPIDEPNVLANPVAFEPLSVAADMRVAQNVSTAAAGSVQNCAASSGVEGAALAEAVPAAPSTAAASADRQQPKEEKKDEVKDGSSSAPVASSSGNATQRSLVEQVFKQNARKTANSDFRRNIMNILHAPLPLRTHLDNLLESLCASTDRMNMYNADYDEDEFDDKKDEKKEEKQEPRSVFMDGSPSAMAMIGNDEDDVLLQEDDKIKDEPIPVEVATIDDADALLQVDQHQI